MVVINNHANYQSLQGNPSSVFLCYSFKAKFECLDMFLYLSVEICVKKIVNGEDELVQGFRLKNLKKNSFPNVLPQVMP